MQNLLESFKEEFAKQITKKITEFTNDVRIDEYLGKMQEMKDNIPNSPDKEKIAAKLENSVSDAKKAAKDKVNATIGNAATKIEGLTNEAVQQAQQKIEEVKSDIMDLGTSCGHLITSTAQFAARIAMIPPGIIVTTPMGPGVATNLIPPMLQQIKCDGDNLSKTYDRCNCLINKLGLRILMRNIPIIGSVMGVIDTAMGIAESFIPLTGSPVTIITTKIVESASGAIEDIAEEALDKVGQIANIEPPISFNYSASGCSSFSYIVAPPDPETDPGDVSAGNCSRFETLQVEYLKDEDGNPVIDENGNLVEDPNAVYTPDCNNCKNYK